MINNIIQHWNKFRSASLAGKDDPFSIEKVYMVSVASVLVRESWLSYFFALLGAVRYVFSAVGWLVVLARWLISLRFVGWLI